MSQPHCVVDQHWSSLDDALRQTRAVAPTIRRWGRHLAQRLSDGSRLLVCGNGGSAAEAQHLTGELVGRFVHDRRPFSAIALHADTSASTAIANDYGEHEYFARQVWAHGREGDILMALSTSGRSQNVVAAAKTARGLGLTTWGLTGPAPNRVAALCEDAVAVDTERTATVQEIHLAVIHALCAVLDEELGVST